LAKAKKDIVAQSRAYWELGRLYQTHNKLVSALSEFQRALQLLEDERAMSTGTGAPTHQHYELELLFQLGLTAKEMADIFQQTDYLDKALAIAQTDRKFLPQYTQISMELGRAHLVSENPQVALRSFEAYLRSLIFGQHSPTQPSHTALDISRIDWGSVAVGCYQIGATLRMLNQEKGGAAQELLEYGELAREFLSKAEGLAEAVGDKETKNQAHSLLERSALPTGGRRTSEPPANTISKDKVDASPKKSEPQEEEEDWDAELGIAAEEDRPALAHLLVSTSKAKVERVPLKHRLFEAVSNQTFEIVKFPKPTFLHTYDIVWALFHARRGTRILVEKCLGTPHEGRNRKYSATCARPTTIPRTSELLLYKDRQSVQGN
jgi:tetratricopeptide (TPR) repeat protein